MRRVSWLALAVLVASALAAALTSATDPPAAAQGRGGMRAAAAGRPAFTVRLLFGLTDTQPTVWEGSVRPTGATVDTVDGWRFLPADDRVTGPLSWTLRTDAAGGPNQRRVLPNGVLLSGRGGADAAFEVTTGRGSFSFRLEEARLGEPRLYLEGAVSVERMPAAEKLTADPREDDFASIAAAPDGTVWAAWQSYSGLQDEIRLRRHDEGGWHTFTRVPGISGDVWRPQVAIDANHHVWVVWAQQTDGNWDLYARATDGQQWYPETRLTEDPLPDINHHLVSDGSGNLCVAWQGFRAGPRTQSDIFLKHFNHFTRRWSSEIRVSSDPANDWEPAVSVDSRGNAWVAWDSYGSGSYDVLLRSVPLRPDPASPAAAPLKVAATSQAEMRATVTCDRSDRVWVAFEVARPGWGKDQGYTIRQNPVGTPLGGPRDVAVRVLEGGTLRQPAAGPESAMPEGERGFLYTPQLLADDAGRVWLSVRHKGTRTVRNAQRTQVRNFWEEWVTRYEGDRWAPAIVLPASLGRQSIYSDLSAARDGTLWAAWTTDNRRFNDPHRPIHTEVYAASIPAPAVLPAAPSLQPVPAPAAENPPAGRLGEHPNEAADLAAIREYRVRIGRERAQIVRGDLHRHTELSWDGGGGSDGSVLDFFRYMIDAASMDFGAVTDHNAGGDYEYWWWLTQKLTDLYHTPGGYISLYGYERSAVYPNGHRNIIHTRRNVPVVSFFTLPTLSGDRPGVGTGALLENDTKLLYDEIRKTGGIAISHTSATRMGTDWRDNDPELEPVVEMFQGARTSYEYVGAPKSADPGRDGPHVAQAGYEPAGFVWNAWRRGYRLGVITSSDHGSTHMSYAMVYATKPTREGVLEGIRRRHTYGATDNIILEFRMGDAFMGDEITARRVPTAQIRVRGTAELGRIDLVRNESFLYNTDPRGKSADLRFLDASPRKGLNYYYVRVQQEDGQIAWSSPIWINLK